MAEEMKLINPDEAEQNGVTYAEYALGHELTLAWFREIEASDDPDTVRDLEFEEAGLVLDSMQQTYPRLHALLMLGKSQYQLLEAVPLTAESYRN